MNEWTWSTTMFRYLTAVRDCAFGIMGPKVSQENIAHIITGLCCPAVHPGAIASVECIFDVVADIAFIVDQSSNIRSKNFQLLSYFLKNTIRGLDVGEGKIKIAVVLYSDFPRADVFFNTFNDMTDILRYISSIPHDRGKTYTGAALKFAKEHVFTKARGSRRDQHVQQVAVVITDGKSTDNVASAAAALRRSGITVFALGIKDTDEDDLREIASYPHKKFVFSVEGFDKLNSLSNILTKTLCNEITDSIIPAALQSFVLQDCKKTIKADIYFLLDESESISYKEFDDMKNFIKKLLEAFEVGNNHVRFGLVKFASRATTVFRLHDYNTNADIRKAVNVLKIEGGGTRTDLGLREMIPLFEEAVRTRGEKVHKLLIVITDGESRGTEEYYNTNADIRKAVNVLKIEGGGTRTDLGLREMIPLFEEAVRTREEKVHKLLIVITDGESRGTEESVEVPAKLLRTEQNVSIYAIGVKYASVPELELISGSPQRIFYVKNYDFLDEIKKDIITEICTFEGEIFS
ncbi:collagen alpha-4(VI) chain-like [Sinocyclocheilus rhinocerous]|uniref:collagen alpha-4(VI) chain-like n=1 Tax=Sinocyclocheilus rhinocerous TaxID=307959 RepID=UPI0007B86FBA|nr:PREDICTED: collagen alpha-4(VI) chain-like [Sinocyclocheilus rhinocerous]